MLALLKDTLLSGRPFEKSQAYALAGIQGADMVDLFAVSNRMRDAFRGDSIELCAIINAKSGGCSEDCAYCAQSSKSRADITTYPLVQKEVVLKAAVKASAAGVRRLGIVTSGKKARKEDLKKIASMLRVVCDAGLIPCASLGVLAREELRFLKDKGLDRFHHNLETSERFFPKVCTTHTYRDKLKTIEAARAVGLSVCSGGIFGMGETWKDRVDMAFCLKGLDVDSVPINFLSPVQGTPLGNRKLLNPLEALKTISLYRFILPAKQIRICGGRMPVLNELTSQIFMAGADALMTGDYLTTAGRSYEEDVRLIRRCGLRVA